jgi:hypothetical protein
MEAFTENCGARVLLNTEATPELLGGEKYNAVIAALRADLVMPRLPGRISPMFFGRRTPKTAPQPAARML